MLADMFSANQGTEKTSQHPLELVTEDAVDDEVDRAVHGDQEIVCLSESVVHLAKVLKMLNYFLKTYFSFTSRMLTTSARILQMKKTATTQNNIMARPISFLWLLTIRTKQV
jgi:hypothetical protein